MDAEAEEGKPSHPVTTLNRSENTANADDLAYQEAALQEVSRTFALTIPQLRGELSRVVGNAYLLCRIEDTIEDSAELTFEEKQRFARQFVEVLERKSSPTAFAESLVPQLGESTSPTEKELIANAERVVRITHGFSEEDQAALVRCVRIMAKGMGEFQEGQFADGLRDQAHLDAYCYYVAGVVGEMLTALFCAHSPRTARNRAALEALAVSFGQALQMTNILKDVWDDRGRGACWLPRATFLAHGFDLAGLSETNHGQTFEQALGDLIAVAHRHLVNALEYTLLIPRSESGTRRFCLWALGMALLTLRNLNRHRDFTSGDQVKISRRSVYVTVLVTKLIGRSNALLRLVFACLARGLPPAAPEEVGEGT